MASTIIHLCVANELNKKLKRRPKEFLIGSIAPDISKLIGENKEKSHFQDPGNNSIPNLDDFLYKYKNNLCDDFVLGYYVHLATDYIWFKYFISEFVDDIKIYKLDGTEEIVDNKQKMEYIYNDYTSMNTELISKYNLELNIFYEDLPDLEDTIQEIPMNKLGILIKKAGIIIANSEEDKQLIFNIEQVDKFISLSVDIIETFLKDIDIT